MAVLRCQVERGVLLLHTHQSYKISTLILALIMNWVLYWDATRLIAEYKHYTISINVTLWRAFISKNKLKNLKHHIKPKVVQVIFKYISAVSEGFLTTAKAVIRKELTMRVEDLILEAYETGKGFQCKWCKFFLSFRLNERNSLSLVASLQYFILSTCCWWPSWRSMVHLMFWKFFYNLLLLDCFW